jgi:hypothetical protein
MLCKITDNDINKDLIREWFYLDDDDITIRRAKDGYYNRYKKGDIVKPYISKYGYQSVQMPRKRTSLHIAAILCVLRNIDMPKGYDMDHIDGDKTNNTRNNLRMVNRQVNNKNRCKRSDNTSGITGIRWCEVRQHYIIRKTIGKTRHSTSRKTMAEAVVALQIFCDLDDSYTARHGK